MAKQNDPLDRPMLDLGLPPGTELQLDHSSREYAAECSRYNYPGGGMDRLEDNRRALSDGVRRMWDLHDRV